MPEQVGLSSIEQFAGLLATDQMKDLTVVLAGSDPRVHPIALCMLAALADVALASGGQVVVDGVAASADSSLQRMQFFEGIKRTDLVESAQPEPTGNRIPLRQIRDNKEMKKFATDFIPLLHTTPSAGAAVSYVMWELVRNVIEHAGSSCGAFAAAEIDAAGRILIGVADGGIGVTKSIRRSHSAPDERRAISLAFQPGVSGATSAYGGNETNGGAGLFFMKSMASLAQQHMVMITDSTLMRLEKHSMAEPVVHSSLDQDIVSWFDLSVPFPGTAVGVNLSLEETVAFSELLKEIGKIYHLDVRAGKNAAKKAKFT